MSRTIEDEIAELESNAPATTRRTASKRNLSDGENDPEALKEQIAAILTSAGSPESFSITLSKFDTEKNSWPQITKFQNVTVDNVPDADSIGKKYGSGKYQIFLRWKDSNKAKGWALETRTFELHGEYDKYLRNPEAPKSTGLDSFKEAAAILTPLMGNHNNGDMVAMMQTMTQQSNQMMQMMMAQQQSQQALMMTQMQQANQQNMAMMAQMTQIMAASMNRPIAESPLDKLLPIIIQSTLEEKRENKSDMIGTMREMMSLTKEFSGGEKEEKEESTVMQVTQMVLQFLPLLMDKAVDAMKVKAMINTDPDAQRVLSNPKQMAQIGERLAAQIPPEQMKIVSEKTGIPIPATPKEIPVPVNGVVNF